MINDNVDMNMELTLEEKLSPIELQKENLRILLAYDPLSNGIYDFNYAKLVESPKYRKDMQKAAKNIIYNI